MSADALGSQQKWVLGTYRESYLACTGSSVAEMLNAIWGRNCIKPKSSLGNANAANWAMV